MAPPWHSTRRSSERPVVDFAHQRQRLAGIRSKLTCSTAADLAEGAGLQVEARDQVFTRSTGVAPAGRVSSAGALALASGAPSACRVKRPGQIAARMAPRRGTADSSARV
jgi:hypothetical protein